jgi:hypothetical protein
MTAVHTAPDKPADDAMPGSIPELLALRRAQPDGEFLVTDDERLSFAEADAQSRALADALLAGGVGKGTRVGILFPNCAQWIIAWLAAARIGALTVPLSTFAPGAELSRLLRHTDTQVVLMGRSIAGRDLVDRMSEALPGLADGDAAIALPGPLPAPVHVWPDCDRPWTTPWPGTTGPVAPLTGSAERRFGRPTISCSSPRRGRRRCRNPSRTRTAAWCATPTSWRTTGASPQPTASIPDAVLLGRRTDDGCAAGTLDRRSRPRTGRFRTREHRWRCSSANGRPTFRAGHRPVKPWPTTPTSPNVTCPACGAARCSRRCRPIGVRAKPT